MNASFDLEALETRTLFSIAWGAVPQLIGLDQAAVDFPKIMGQGQSVAVLDTGVDYNHPSLGGGFGKKVIAGYDFVQHNSNSMDTVGHGTAVAGVIAAQPFVFGGNLYRGVAPSAKIISLRIEDSSESLPGPRVAKALHWVLVHRKQYNITAVNLSIGNGLYSSPVVGKAYGGQLAALRKAGVFIAVSSGNDGTSGSIEYPAADPSVFAVGSVDTGGSISSFTSLSPQVSMLAPGNDVPTTLYIPSNQDHTYVAATGTSFSAPFAAGAAVLVRQVNPKLSPDQIANILRNSGTPVQDNNTGATYQLINIDSALRMAYKTRAAVVKRHAVVKVTPATQPRVVSTPAALPNSLSGFPFNTGQKIGLPGQTPTDPVWSNTVS